MEVNMQEELDKVSLLEVIEIYNNITAMLKSLKEKETALLESEKNE